MVGDPPKDLPVEAEEDGVVGSTEAHSALDHSFQHGPEIRR